MTTSGVKQRTQACAEEWCRPEELSAAATTTFRSTADRCNYLSLDSCDLSYATKELCRRMAAPDESSHDALGRVF